MRSRYQSQLGLAGVILSTMVLASTRAGEPSAQELVALAPVLDSSDGGCRSLSLRGWAGGDGKTEPNLRFQAIYQAPNRFSLLIDDVVDGTPLVFCSGTKMFVYDPLTPTVYYSEDASFTLEMLQTSREFRFNLVYLMGGRKPHRIFVDFRSILSFMGHGIRNGPADDRVATHGINRYELIRNFQGRSRLTLNVDPTKNCPYTAADFTENGVSYLRFDRLSLNGSPGKEPFVFPAKERLTQRFPVKVVTGQEDFVAGSKLSEILGRAIAVRAFVNRDVPPASIKVPDIPGVDWDRVRQNDKKLAKALRELVPPSVRAR